MTALTARDVLYGNPPTAAHEPAPADFRTYLESLENLIGAGAIKGFAASEATLPLTGNTDLDTRLVLSDDADERGIWQWQTDAWVRIHPLPTIFGDSYFAGLAQAWAESDTAPGGTGTKSAKTYATESAASANSSALSSASAGASSGRLDIAAFSQLATKFVYSSPGEGQEVVAEGDVVLWRGASRAFIVAAAAAVDAPYDYTGSGGAKFYDLAERAAETLALLATAPDGTIFPLEGLWYEVDSTQAGTDSCAYDLGQDALKPFGTARPEHFGIDITGATDVTAALDRMIGWCIANSVPMDFDGVTSLVSGTVGPTTPITGNMRLLPGKWAINVTADADPADHVGHIELSGGNSINECDITIDCNDRIAGGFWIRQNTAGGIGQNRGFVHVKNGLQRDAAATTENAGWAYFGPFLYVDPGRGRVDGMNRLQNAVSAATSGLILAGATSIGPTDGWSFENIGADTQLPLITVTGITQANPAVVTAAGHGLVTGSKVLFSPLNSGGASMEEIEGTAHTVTVIDSDTFSLDGVDSTGFTAFTGTGYAIHEIYDFDGVKIFLKAGATTYARRDGRPVVRNCRFRNITGRAAKFQGAGVFQNNHVEVVGIPIMRNAAYVDGQIGAIEVRGNRFEFKVGAGVNPFLTGVSASAVVAQMSETDNEMAPQVFDSVLVCGAELPYFVSVLPSSLVLDGAVVVDGVIGLREDGYSGDLLRSGLSFIELANVVSSGSAVSLSVRNARGPFGAPAIGYNGLSSGSATNVFLEAENNANTGTFVRAIEQASGSQLDMTQIRLWGNGGFNHLYSGAVFDFKDLPAFTAFEILQGSGTHTNAPSAWGGFAGTVFGSVRTGPKFYGNSLASVDLDAEVGGVVVATFRTKQATAANKWQEFRAVEQQPALSASVPSDVTVTATTGTLPTPDGSVTVADAAAPTNAELLELVMELRANQNALADVVGEVVTDLTAANVHAS